MNLTKNVTSSTTMWAAIIAVAGALLSTFGFDLGIGASEDVTAAIGAITTAFGALWVVIERWKKGDLYIKRPKD